MGQQPTSTLSGTVKRVRFTSDRFCAGILSNAQGEHSFRGTFAVEQESYLSLRGAWVDDPQWGRQFEVRSIVPSAGVALEGMVHFIARAHVPGIGKVKAGRIVAAFGDELPTLLETADPRLSKHLTADQIATLRGLFGDTVRPMILAWLTAIGCNGRQALQVWAIYGADTVARVEANPWLLAEDVDGIGFVTADRMGLALGCDPLSVARFRAAVVHVLKESTREGHTCIPGADLRGKVFGALYMAQAQDRILGEAITGLLADGVVVDADTPAGLFIGLTRYRDAEVHTVGTIREMGAESWGLDRCAEAAEVLAHLEATDGLALNPDQRAAVEAMFSRRALVVTGGAGTGKTFIVATVIKILDAMGLSYALCAPTGKAAKRIAQVTGHTASTVHRLLGFQGGRFMACADLPLRFDVVIVDEVSMVDVTLAHALVSALKRGAVLVLVGDYHQLPSVGPGNLLKDLIELDVCPVARLSQVVRQAGTLKRMAHAVNAGEFHGTANPDLGTDKSAWLVIEAGTDQEVADRVVRLAQKSAVDRGYDPLQDVQVLAPMRRGTSGVDGLNEALQRAWQGAKIHSKDKRGFCVGDKVVCVKNSYAIDVMNGEMGLVVRSDTDPSQLAVRFEGGTVTGKADAGEEWPDVVLAYAMTIHKAQGSEWPLVIVVVTAAHQYMHDRCLLYTAVTRAMRCVIVVGQRRVMDLCARKTRSLRRHTWTRLDTVATDCYSTGEGDPMSATSIERD